MAKKTPKSAPVRRLAGTIKRKCIAPSPTDPQKTCNKEFEAKNAKGVYCSPECKARAHYQKKKDGSKVKVKSLPTGKKKGITTEVAEPVKKVAAKTNVKPRTGTMTVITTPSPEPKKVAANTDYLERRRNLKTGGKDK